MSSSLTSHLRPEADALQRSMFDVGCSMFPTSKAGEPPSSNAPLPMPRFSFALRAPVRSGVTFRRRFVAAMSACVLIFLPGAFRSQAVTIELPRSAQTDSQGVLLRDVVPSLASDPAGELKISKAPIFGQAVSVSRHDIVALLKEKAPDLAVTNWAGAEKVAVTRRVRPLAEEELRQMFVELLQKEQVKERGELELRFGRAWTAVSVPDEPLTIRLVDMPHTGVSANFIVRFDVLCGAERVGTWQAVLQARVWREILVASSTLRRGETLATADISAERRDVLLVRDFVPSSALQDASLELGEGVTAGQPLPSRAVRVRPVIVRGSFIEGLIQDGPMTISIKVEALEDGLMGQNLRVRNPKTRRELLGKVHNEQIVILHL
jgi:flagella basal body P-ring formation protein FlgA